MKQMKQMKSNRSKTMKGKKTHVAANKAVTIMPKRQTTISNIKTMGGMGGYLMSGSSTGL